MTNDSMMKFSQNLKNYLKKNNLSLKEFADQICVPVSTVHGWINGVPPKNIKVMKKVSEVIGCSVDDLCFDEVSCEIKTDLVISIGSDSYTIYLKKHKERL